MNHKIYLLFTINTFTSMGYSIIAPLFPVLGEKISLTENLLGWIISIYSLANFIITPFVPQIVYTIGRKKLVYTSNILLASSILLYGFLVYIKNYYLFLFISFGIRILNGLSGGVTSTLIYSIGVSLSPAEEIVKTLGYLEIAWSLGVSIGPILASCLYHFGGFSLPFYTIGILFFIVIYFIKILDISENKGGEESPSFFKFFNGEMFSNFIPTVIFQIAQTYYFPSLTYHLTRNWNLIGQFVIIFGAPFVYPLNFLPQSIFSIIFGLALLGSSGAFTCVAVIIQYGKIAKKIDNLIDDSSANDIASAVFNLGIYFGDFLGPVYGGFVGTNFGFKYSNVYMSLLAFITFVYYYLYYRTYINSVILDICKNGLCKVRYSLEDEKNS